MPDLTQPASELLLSTVVHSALPEDTVQSVVEKMRTHNIGSIAITSQDQTVLGIFTERDYIRKIAGQESQHYSAPIQNFMTPNPKSILITDPIRKAVVSMRLGKFRHIVIQTPEGKLENIISVKDILDWILS